MKIIFIVIAVTIGSFENELYEEKLGTGISYIMVSDVSFCEDSLV